MQEKPFHSKAPDLLRDLAAHIERVLVDFGGIAQTQAECLALEVVERIAKAWGGQNLYFPMGTAWRSHKLAQKVWEEFNGRNIAEVAQKNSVSLQWAYKIIKSMRAQETARRQCDLFNQST